MQRLFSTFANGWPGKGLLVQRALLATIVAYSFLTGLGAPVYSAALLPDFIVLTAAVLVLIGLWTPIAGSVVALIELYIAFSRGGDPWFPISAGVLAGTLAVIGPGAWSIDARLFGRKHIDISTH
jgi:putative oxidoreductase